MANTDNERVEYQFTGNVSSLKKTVQQAMNLLDSYQAQIDRLTKMDGFTKNQKTAKSFATNLQGVSKEVAKLQQMMGELSKVRIPTGSAEAQAFRTALGSMSSDVAKMSSATKLSASEIKQMIANLRAAKTELSSTGSGVQELVNKEQAWQDKMQRVADVSDQTAQRIKSAFDSMRNRVSHFGEAIMQQIPFLQSMKDKAADAFGRVKDFISSAVHGLRQFKPSADEAGDATDDAGDAALAASGKFGAFLAVMKKILPVLAKIGKTIGSGLVAAFKGITSVLGSFKSKMDDTKKSIAQFVAGLGIGDALGAATTKSMEFIENQNLFQVAMGKSVEEGQKFIDTMAEIYGMDPSNLYKTAGYFYELTDAIGVADDASKIISLSLTKASNDIASLFNVDIDTVSNNLASGMQGMTRAVRKYGIDIRNTTLQQTAYRYGLEDNVSTMSEANRQALRFITMMDQVRNATKQVTTSVDGATKEIGDFARNIETPANQLRIFKEQVSVLGRSIGNFFIPVMQKCLYVINGFIMALSTMLQFLAALMGIDASSFGGEVSSGAERASDSVGGIGDAAADAKKKLDKLVAPFDELNILSEEASSSGGAGGLGDMGTIDPALLKALEEVQLDLDDIRMKAKDVQDSILNLFGFKYDENGDLTTIVGGFADQLITAWNDQNYTGVGEAVARFLNRGIAWGVSNITWANLGPQISAVVLGITGMLNGFVATFDWSGLGTIIGNGLNIALNTANLWLTSFDFTKFGASLAAGLNSMIATVDWDLFGTTLANWIMSKINAINGFLVEFDWASFGVSLGNGLLALINGVDWAQVGMVLVNSVNGLIDGIRNFFAAYEWGTLGASLAEFFSTAFREINWLRMGTAISDTLRTLLHEIIAFLGNMDWIAVGSAVTEFILGIDWLGLLTDLLIGIIGILKAAVGAVVGLFVGIFTGIGQMVSEGFKDGIVQGLKNIGSWLYDHFVQPIVDGVKTLFGIHSPSTVFSEIGGFILDGLFKGMTNFGNKIKDFGKGILDGVKNFFGIHSPSTEFEELGEYMNAGLTEGLTAMNQNVAIFQAMLDNMYAAVTVWNTNVFQVIESILTKARQANVTLESSTRVLTTNMSSMYASMATSSINAIQAIINKLNQIPRNITTIHTVITQSGSSVSNTGSSGRRMASGGVVTGPTRALIGEGIYDEAVIPLGNSPQMQELVQDIANAVKDKGSGGGSGQPVEVHVYLGGKEIDAEIYQASKRGEKVVGAQPIKTEG